MERCLQSGERNKIPLSFTYRESVKLPEKNTKFLTKNVCIYLDDVVAPTHTINAKEVKQKSWLKTLLLQCDA